MIVCFEGIDGCGKSTQIKMLSEVLTKKAIPHQVIKHPGQTEFGRQLRKLILYGIQPESDLAHRLLFWADLAETMKHYETNEFLIFDRHPRYSNYTYGSGMPGFNKAVYFILNNIMMEKYMVPDATFVIDVPVDVAFLRLQKRSKELTAVEKRGAAYFEKVRKAYLELAEIFPEVVVLDGTVNPDALHEKILCMARKRNVL